MKNAMDIMQLINDEDVEFIRLQFTDIYGMLKNIAVTRGQIPKIISNKFKIDSAVLFGEGPGYTDDLEEELYLYPILDSFTILPWRPQQSRVGKFLCNVCYEDGTPYEMSTRTVLSKVVEAAKEKGYSFLIKPECEFFLFHCDDNGLPTTLTHEQAGFMDVGPVDFGENARREMVLSLEEMGFEVESSHHEKAPAQHEIDFQEKDALEVADALMTFKFAVRSIAKRFGLYATFMPKPKEDVAGSGMHLNISILKDGKNIFDSEDELPADAGAFIQGIINHAKGMSAFTNPIVNSYKRIITGFDAPGKIGWVEKGDDTIIKLKKSKKNTKIELTFPDAASNPYLAIAVAIASGMKGIEDGLLLEPEFSDKNSGVDFPQNLKDAVCELKKDSFITSVVGDKLSEIYAARKLNEWNRYMKTISDWELNTYLYRM